MVVNTTTTNPPQATTQTNLYPPIGRAGYQDEEEVYVNGSTYVWSESEQKWNKLASTGSRGQL